MDSFREAINSTEGRKVKSKPPLGGVYKDVEVKDARGQFFLLLELSALTELKKSQRVRVLPKDVFRKIFGKIKLALPKTAEKP